MQNLHLLIYVCVLSNKQKMEQRLIILMTLLCFVSSGWIIYYLATNFAKPLFFSITGIVKRDTIEDIGNSIVNSVKEVVGMDEDRGIIEDMKIEVIYI